MPLISVIIPAYNAEKTIGKTIQSVLDQTLTDFEAIVINDGSTDQTLAVLEAIEDPRVQVFTFPNAGPQKSRNRGIEKAQGQYLAFLDADDLWTKDKLTDQFQALQDNPTAVMAYSWTNWIDGDDQVWRRGAHIAVSGRVAARLLLSDFIGSGSNPLIATNIVNELGGFDEAIRAGQDWEMWLRVASHYPVVAVPKVHVLYRKLATSTAWSNNVERQAKGYRQVVEKTIRQSPETLQPLRHQVLGNLYKSLTVDSLERAASGKQTPLAASFVGRAIFYDPSLLRSRVLYKAFVRVLLLALLPNAQYRSLVKKLGKWGSIDALYGYQKLDTDQHK